VDLLIVELSKVIMSIVMFIISRCLNKCRAGIFLRAVHSYLCKIAVKIQEKTGSQKTTSAALKGAGIHMVYKTLTIAPVQCQASNRNRQ